jgi:hypothetical protein
MSTVLNTAMGLVVNQEYGFYDGVYADKGAAAILFADGVSGTFQNCAFHGMVQFGGSHVAGRWVRGAAIDGTGLRFEGCTFDCAIIGDVNGMYLSGGTALSPLVMTPPDNMSGAVAICGSYNVIDGFHIDVHGTEHSHTNMSLPSGTNAYGIEFGGTTVVGGVESSKGNVVRDSSIRGVRQETIGWDSGVTPLLAYVSGVNGSVVTLAQNRAPAGGTPLVGAGLVGMHLSVGVGAAEGAYYEVLAQTDAALTIDTAKFAAPTVGDFVTVCPCFVENLFENVTLHLNGQTYIKYGYGCNAGFIFWGNCHGNEVSHCLAIADGLPNLTAWFGYDVGIGVSRGGRYSDDPNEWFNFNSHNYWHHNEMRDERVNPTVPVTGMMVWSNVNDPEVGWTGSSSMPADYMRQMNTCTGNYGARFEDNDFGDTVVRFHYGSGITWLRNQATNVSTIGDGDGGTYDFVGDDTEVYPQIFGFHTYAPWNGNDGYNCWFMPYGFNIPNAFANQDVFINRGYDLLLEVLPPEMRCYGSVILLTETVGAVTSRLPAAGVVDVGALPVGGVTSDIEVAGQGLSSVAVRGATTLTTRFRGFDLLLDVLASVTAVRGRVEMSCRVLGEATLTVGTVIKPVVVKPPEGHIIHAIVKPHVTQPVPRGGARVKQHRVGKGITIE